MVKSRNKIDQESLDAKLESACKALAYAIVAIERLPENWREESDKRHMSKMLDELAGESSDYYITNARSHLERRGVVIESGKLVLAPREPGTVVSLDGADHHG